MSKLALGLAGAGGATGLGATAAYKAGLFSSTEEAISLTVRETLSKEGYELVSTDEKFKAFFTEFKGDGSFISEVEKHKKEGEDLKNDNGDKGKEALKALCSSYLDSKDNLDKAIKWCVLRIQDKPLPESKTWKNIETGETDKSTWETAFNSFKDKMVEYKVEGISQATTAEQGYSILKGWCSNSKKLPINNQNRTVQTNAISWCIN
ncbi:hypothetical protein HF1_03460 [Mycoplasma haemofelis str. Langford 1]|uniref:Uncharacterized protein n=1 Tax=Mycoplasma haemofelis (strain Langford 1) TaxID=941640 RepID=E8ZGT3_MYCHL|nr:hypothetical protein [Mycoplasma haemofelis]CBY92354.1 hypothetical protein HF1_03460 [Mycoplasma haemofelis str. Langford 1]